MPARSRPFTAAIIIAGAAGFGFGSNSADFPNLIYMIQMSMLFAGVATLFQTVGLSPVGARLPTGQGTSFAFIPIMIPLVVIVVTLGLKFFARGMLSVSAVLLGLIVGYIVAYLLGMVSFANIGKAATFALPSPVHFGLDFSVAAVVGFCLMGIISAIEAVGDVSGITSRTSSGTGATW